MTTSPLANPTATRELLEEFGLATKHRLGQNFLIDNHVIERICELAELAGDERVLEVGPGVGTLTLALLQEAACVTSIEADPELEPVLDAHAADYANFRFIMGDALKVGPEQIEQAAGGEPTVFVANLPYNVAATIILQFFQTMPALKRAVVMVQKEVADRIAAVPGNKTYGGYTACVTSIEADPELEPVLDAHAADYANFRFIMGDALKVGPEQIEQAAGGEPTVFVANLPYNVAATIILQFFQTMPALKRAVVMVQKEVADRIAAVPGNKTYGGYTAKLGLYAQVTGRFEVPPRCFMPAPHVDSAVVRIDRVDGVVPEGLDREFVARVIDAAFAQRRKTIRNSMSANGFAKDVLDAAFEVCGIAPTTRAETLDVADFVRLARELIHDA